MTGQLDLLKSRRQRGTRPPPAYELATHCAVVDTLHLATAPGWLWSHFPAGEKRNPATAARLKRMGLKAGWPDLLLISPTGKIHCMELKRGRNPLSEAQEQFQAEMVKRKIPYAVARSYREAIATLRDWGAVRRVVPQ